MHKNLFPSLKISSNLSSHRVVLDLKLFAAPSPIPQRSNFQIKHCAIWKDSTGNHTAVAFNLGPLQFCSLFSKEAIHSWKHKVEEEAICSCSWCTNLKCSPFQRWKSCSRCGKHWMLRGNDSETEERHRRVLIFTQTDFLCLNGWIKLTI